MPQQFYAYRLGNKFSKFFVVWLSIISLLFSSLPVDILKLDNFIGSAQAAEGVPELISYQGRLYDSSGNLLGGAGTNYYFRFSIWDAPSGGAKLWPAGTPSTMTYQVRYGVFNAQVGDTGAGGDALTLDFNNDTYYLQVEVASLANFSDGETLSPRQRVTSAGYAKNADMVDGYHASSTPAANQVVVLDASGNLSFGTNNPIIQATNSLSLQTTVAGDINLTPTAGQVKIVSATTTQLTVGYDANNRLDVKVSSSGAVTFDAVGAGAELIASDNFTVQGQIFVTGTATSTIAGDVNFDSGTLYVDSVNNRVGIGTTSPSYNLAVNGTTNITGAVTLQSTLNVTGNTTLGNTSSTNLSVSNNSYFNTINATGQTVLANVSSTNLTVSGDSYLGTVRSGTWNGSIITPSYGGLGIDASSIAKGGLITGTGAGAFGILAIGSNGLCLTASSTATGGVAWSDCATASGAITNLNGLSAGTQYFATSTSGGLNLYITSAGSTHTFTLQPASNYSIPLTASTTEWAGFYATPSTRISAGTGLSWSGNTLNATNNFSGTGINGYITRWASSTGLTTGILLDNGTVAGVNATSATTTFNIRGVAGQNPFNIASSTGANMVTVLQNGNVGVGTTSPISALHVVGAITVEPNVGDQWGLRYNTGIFSNSGIKFQPNNVIRIVSNGADIQTIGIDNSATTLFKGYSSKDVFNVASSSGLSYFYVNNVGNVGIGTTTPAQKLVVVGDARVTGALYDSTNSAGNTGMLLQTTGAGTQWVTTSSLGIVSGVSSVTAGDGIGQDTTTGDINLWINPGTGITTSSDQVAIDTNAQLTWTGTQTFANVSSTNLTVATDSYLNNLKVAGPILASSTLAVTGVANLYGATTLSSTLNVLGQTTLVNASTTNFTVSGNAYLGNIIQGTWNGSVITPTYGGLGFNASSINTGGLIVGSGSGTFGILAVGGDGLCLTASSTATNGIAWTSCALASGAITSLNGLTTATQTFATGTDTNIGLNIVSSGSTHTFTPTFTGQLAVSRGGTGVGTFTTNGILYGNGTDPIQVTTAAANSVLVTNGSNVPSLSQTLPTAVQGNITQLGILTQPLLASSTLVVTGATTLYGVTTINNTLNVTGQTTLANTSSTNLTVSGNSYLNTLNASGAVTLNSTLNVTGQTTLANVSSTNLTVSNNSYFNTISATGQTTLTNVSSTNLSVSTNTYLNTLRTSGAILASSTLAVTGASTFYGATNINNTLNVTGQTTLANVSSTNITSSGTGYFNALRATGQTTLANVSSTNLSVSGNSYLGTVMQGTWNGSTVTVPYGGTGATSLTGLVIGNTTSPFTATTTSAGLANVISDETGSGALVFGTSPVFTTQISTPQIVSAADLILAPAGGDIFINTLNNLHVSSTNLVIANGVTLGGAGTSNLTSGARFVGVYDEFTNSNSSTVQQVLKDLDTAIQTAVSGSVNSLTAGDGLGQDLTQGAVTIWANPGANITTSTDQIGTVMNPTFTTSVTTPLLQNNSGNLTLQTNTSGNIILNAAAGGTIELQDNTNITGTLAVSGALSASSTLAVTGATTLYGATSINNTLNVTGQTTLANASTTNLTVSNNAYLNNLIGTGQTTLANVSSTNLTVSTNTYLNTLNVSGASALNGTLNVTGQTTLANASTTNLTVSGNLYAGIVQSGTWQAGVIADTYIANDLTISGGTINNTPIGATTPSTGVFTNVTTTNLYVSGTLTANLNGSAVTSTYATNLIGGGPNYIPYQSATSTTSFIPPLASAILGTNGSGIPAFGQTLPSIVQGNITQLGILSQPLLSSSTVFVTGASTFYGAVAVNNTLNVTGQTTLANVSSTNLTVSNNSYFNTISATGQTTLTNVSSTNLSVSTNTYLNTLRTSGAILASSTLGVSGAVTLHSTLNVQGQTILGNVSSTNLTVSTNSYFNTITATGQTTLANVSSTNITSSGTGYFNVLRATGQTTLVNVSSTNLTVSGNSYLNTLNASGAVALGSTLNVTGATTMSNASTTNLTISGNSYLGTVMQGTWQGSIIAPTYGGLGINASTVAKGGLITGTGAGTFGILAVGANGLCLTASSTAANGVAWADCATASGAITSLNGLTTATQTFATSTSGGLQLNITSTGSTHTFALQPASGYTVPLSASTTEWSGFYATPSTRITAGTGLSWSGNTLNASNAFTGSGITNYVARWTNTNALGTGIIVDTGTKVGIGTTTPSALLTVQATSTADKTVLIRSITGQTGNLFELQNAANSQLLSIDSTGRSIFTASTSTDAFVFNQTGTGNIAVFQASGTPIFTIGQSLVSSEVPLAINSVGDTGIAGNLIFTNPTASYIKSDAPLYIQAGDLVNNESLYLSGSNAGLVIVEDNFLAESSSTSPIVRVNQTGSGNILQLQGSGNNRMIVTAAGYVGVGSSTPNHTLAVQGISGVIPFSVASSTGANLFIVTQSGNVGVGTTTPAQTLVVAGSARITGAFFDSSNTSGTAGMLLQTTGTGTQWVTTSSLGIVSGVSSVTAGDGLGQDSTTGNLTIWANPGANITTSSDQIATVMNPTFTTSVTTPILQNNSGNLTLQTNTSGNIILNAASGGTIELQDNTNITGALAVSGALNASSTLAVTGATTLYGATNINNTLNVTGQTTLANVSSTNLTVSGNSYLNTLNASGAVALSSTLNVQGQTTLANVSSTNLTVSTNTYLNTLRTSGAILASSTLDVTGGAQFYTGSTFYSGATLFGNNRIFGILADGTNEPGTYGQVLMTTSTGVLWVATSSLGISSSLSGGINGYVARWTSASTLSTGKLLDNGTVVGINATSSSYTFNLQGNAGVNPFNVASSTGSSLLTILQNGNVGIGTNSPIEKLHILNGNILFSDNYGLVRDTNQPYARFTGSMYEFGNIANEDLSTKIYGWVGSDIELNDGLITYNSGNHRFVGGVLASSTLSVSGATLLHNTLNVQGQTTLANVSSTNLTVSGNSYLNTLNASGAVALSSTLNVQGQTTLANVSSTNLTVSTNTYLNTLRTSGAILASSTLGVSGAVTLHSTLNVTGATTLANASTTNLTVATNLYVPGNLRVQSTLYDGSGSAGTAGMLLQTTGSGVTWVATSSLGISSSLSGGINGYVARWTSASTLSTGKLLDNGTVVGINATSSSYTFNLQGNAGVNPFNVASSTGSSLLTVNQAGYVGVGTSTISERLTIAGNTVILPADTPTLLDNYNTTNLYTVLAIGDYVYGISDSGIEIYDVSVPTNIVLTDTDSSNIDQPMDLYVVGKYAYGINAGNSTLQIWDISNPYQIVPKDFDNSTLSYPTSIYVSGAYAYVVDKGYSGLQIFDISDPNNIIAKDFITTGVSSQPKDVYVVWPYAYVVVDNNLSIFDVSDPNNIVAKGSNGNNLSAPNSIYVSGAYAYITDDSADYFLIFNITDPDTPTYLNRVDISNPQDVFVSGNYAYVVASDGNSFAIYDVSDPANIILKNSYDVGPAYSVFVSGKYAYVGGQSNLSILSLNNLTTPTLEAGAGYFGDLQVQDNAWFNNDVSIRGGLSVANGAFLQNGLNVTGQTTLANVSSTNLTVSNNAYFNTISATGQTTLASVSSTNLTVSGNSYLGTVIQGTWQGSVIAPTYGGLGFNASSIAKGGLITGTGAGTFGILAVGANGLCLTASSTATNGVAWTDCAIASGAITSLNGLTTASQTFATSTSGGLQLNITSSGSTHTFALQPASGYTVPLSASTTEWSNFYATPSTRITAGTGLSWSGNTLNASNAFTGSGMTNYVARWASSTGLTTGIIVDTGTNVGIGTTTPLQTLTVVGSFRATGAFYDGSNASGTEGMILQTTGTSTRWVATSTLGLGGGGTPGGSDGQIQYNNGGSFGGAAVFYYDDSNDRIGIGTSTPLARLSVQGAAGQEVLRISSSTGATLLSIESSGNFNFDLNTLYIDTINNRIGIGTSTPQSNLDVVSPTGISTLRIRAGASQGSNNLFEIQDATAAYALLFTSTQELRVYATSSGQYVAMFHDGTNGKIITSSGDLEIGSGGGDLRVYDSSGVDYVQITHDGTDANLSLNAGVFRMSTSTVTAGTIKTGGGTAQGYNSFGSGTPGQSAIASSSDVYIAGELEVDGVAYLSGGTAWTQGDFAERVTIFEASALPGDLIVANDLGGEARGRLSYSANSNKILGVISTAPAGILKNDAPGEPLALTGTVPVKVTIENGIIRRGDQLTTSASVPGAAMKATSTSAGTVGIALEDYTSSSTGYVTILLNINNKIDTVSQLAQIDSDTTSTTDSTATSTASTTLVVINNSTTTIATTTIQVINNTTNNNTQIVVIDYEELANIKVMGQAVFNGLVKVVDAEVSGRILVKGDIIVAGDIDLSGAITTWFWQDFTTSTVTTSQEVQLGDAVAIIGENTVLPMFANSYDFKPAVGIAVAIKPFASLSNDEIASMPEGLKIKYQEILDNLIAENTSTSSTTTPNIVIRTDDPAFSKFKMVKVAISGIVKGYQNLIPGSRYYLALDENISRQKAVINTGDNELIDLINETDALLSEASALTGTSSTSTTTNGIVAGEEEVIDSSLTKISRTISYQEPAEQDAKLQVIGIAKSRSELLIQPSFNYSTYRDGYLSWEYGTLSTATTTVTTTNQTNIQPTVPIYYPIVNPIPTPIITPTSTATTTSSTSTTTSTATTTSTSTTESIAEGVIDDNTNPLAETISIDTPSTTDTASNTTSNDYNLLQPAGGGIQGSIN